MSIQEKEKIKELNRKIKDLEAVIQQKEELLGDYQSIEKIADEKIKGLNTIHAEKVRSLMNSIQLLKKENAGLSKQQKEHKRSELIQQLNKDIADQDLIIEVLRKLVNDTKRADAAIMTELTKGPPRIRVQTREELKMEIQELKSKLLKFEKKKADGQENVDESFNKSEKQLNKEIRTAMSDRNHTGNDAKLAVNSEFILKINDLNNEIEDLKLVVAGKEAEIDKYKELISKKNREINELNQAKTDLKFVLAKNDELKEELEGIRQKLNLDVYNNYEQQIKIEEMEIIAKTHKNIQSKNNEVAKLEFDNMQVKLEDMIKANKNLIADNRRLQDDNTTLRKQNEDLRDKNSKLYAGHTAEMEKMQAKIKAKEGEVKTLSEDIKNFQTKIDKVTAESRNKDLRINSLEERIGQLEMQNSLVLDTARKSIDVSQIDEIERMGELNQSLIEKRDNLEGELVALRLENIRLKNKVRELTKLEIEYCDRIDLLEEENRLQAQKIIAMNLIKKMDGATFNQDEVKLQVRKATEKLDAKIRELTGKIRDLEDRNAQLEEIKKIVDTSYKTESDI